MIMQIEYIVREDVVRDAESCLVTKSLVGKLTELSNAIAYIVNKLTAVVSGKEDLEDNSIPNAKAVYTQWVKLRLNVETIQEAYAAAEGDA